MFLAAKSVVNVCHSHSFLFISSVKNFDFLTLENHFGFSNDHQPLLEDLEGSKDKEEKQSEQKL